MDIFNGVDWQTITFTGLATIGFVNGLTMWKPRMDSRAKYFWSVIFAITASFVPADVGHWIVNKVKDGVEVALMASGAYKMAQKVSGN